LAPLGGSAFDCAVSAKGADTVRTVGAERGIECAVDSATESTNATVAAVIVAMPAVRQERTETFNGLRLRCSAPFLLLVNFGGVKATMGSWRAPVSSPWD
jgi:hypothetical protein